MTELIEGRHSVFEHDSGPQGEGELPCRLGAARQGQGGCAADLIITTPESAMTGQGRQGGGGQPRRFHPLQRRVAVKAGAGSPIAAPRRRSRMPAGRQSVGISRGRVALYMVAARAARHRGIAVNAKAVFTEPGQRVGLVIRAARPRSGAADHRVAGDRAGFVGPLRRRCQTTSSTRPHAPPMRRNRGRRRLRKFLSSESGRADRPQDGLIR